MALAAFLVCNALIAEFVGVKIFALEPTLGLDPFDWNLFGQSGSLSFTSGALLVREGALLAPMYIKLRDWELVRDEALQVNAIQSRTRSTGVRLVRETVKRAFEAASGILARGRAVLEGGAKQLLEKETLMEGDLQDLRTELLALLGAQRAPALLRAAE